jgi:hypothetical protein
MPSKDDYPADAETQLQAAALAMLDLKIIDFVSERQEDYAEFGVVEPTKELESGAKGIGMRVTIRDEKGSDLGSLIIGKQAEQKGDKASGKEEGPKHYFVRQPNKPAIFVTKIDPTHFKTNFSDWIEKDLLKLNGWDVSKLGLKDYSIIFGNDPSRMTFGMNQRMEAVINYDDQKSAWNLASLTLHGRQGEPIASKLSDYEELNSQKLNDLKFAIDDLKIVDVAKKPPGLSANLTADESFTNNLEAVRSLVEKGFVPYEGEILARNGEVHVTTKEGVEYILRFGEIAGQDVTDATKLNRYMFVTTRVDEKQIPPPQLEEEPAEPANVPEPSTPAPKEEGAKGDQGEEGTKASGDGEKTQTKVPELSDTARAEKERIKKANQRKVDEYNDKMKKAKARSAELNARFANWYYVVSEDTYKKIHLSRSDIVKETSKAKEEGFGVDAFRELEKQGLK